MIVNDQSIREFFINIILLKININQMVKYIMFVDRAFSYIST